ncbi:MAG TPA: TonB-dependent receptor, partial [bacterium]|nr:TonB-dependent receptor [bacterium]
SEDHIYYDDGVELHDVNADYVDHYLWSTARWAGRHADLDATAHWTLGTQRRLVGGEGNHDDQHARRLGLRLEAALYPGGRHVVRVGGAADRERGWFRYRSDEAVSVSADGETETLTDFQEEGAFDRVRSSLFIQDEWRPLRPWALNVGLRAAHDTDTDDWRTVPRVSSALELPRQWTLRGAWGVYEQAPQVGIDLEQDVQLRSDRTNRAVHRVLGLEKAVGSARVGLDAWDKDFTDLDGIVTRTAEGMLERHVVTEGFAEGLELWVDRSTATSNWWFSYTLGRSQWSSGEETFDRDFDRLHAFSVSNTFALGRAWDIGTSYTFHTGTPYTEQVWQLDDFQRQWVMEEGEPNSERLPSYQRFDLQVRRHFRFEGWAMTLYAEGLNLTNHENVLWYSWRLANRDGERQPERITRTGVPGLPSVGVEVRF